MAEQATPYQSGLIAFIIALVLLSFSLVVVWFVHYDTGLDWDEPDCSGKPCVFNWHPILMVGGFALMGSTAIVQWRAVPESAGHNNKKTAHALLNVFGYVSAIFGVVAVFKSHNEHVPKFANLYSLHSWLGIAVMVMWGLQVVGGLAAFVLPATPSATRVRFMPYHVFAGIAVTILALVTMLLGIQEKLGFYKDALSYSKLPALAVVGNVAGISIALTAILLAALGVTYTQPNRYNQQSGYERLE
eukprot:comp21028_c0_seq1/m.28248 comp21028_c0_seq1/g.28248  ORF comp21028_c0_seq1/g.28248 comp21028_c0_seq1/m.28248 type:complete len:245 (-) comp21028_c0_seq1:277-1011(-)